MTTERRPATGAWVELDERSQKHIVHATFGPDEARNVGQALGWEDAGGRELFDLGDECERRDAEREEERANMPGLRVVVTPR